MSDRAQKYEAFLDELALVVDGDPEALERHGDFLADDDEARDLRHDAVETAREVGIAGDDYVAPPDIEARILGMLASTERSQADVASPEDDPGRTTSPGFAAPVAPPVAPPTHERFDEASKALSDLALGATVAMPKPVQQTDVSQPPVMPYPATSQPGQYPVGPQQYPVNPPQAAQPTPHGYATPQHPAQPYPVQPPQGYATPQQYPVHPPPPQGGQLTPHGYATPQHQYPVYPPQQGHPSSGTQQLPPGYPHAAHSGSDVSHTRPASAPTMPLVGGVKAAKAGPKRGLLLLFPALGAVAIAAAAVLAFVLWPDDDAAPVPTVATRGIDGTLGHIARAADDGRTGVELRRPNSQAFVALASGERIPTGSIVRTDERTRASVRLADGSTVILNHATELELMSEAPRSFRLRDGEVVADVAHLAGAPHAFFHTPSGRVEVLGTKFELSSTDDATDVRVTRGSVTIAAQGQPSKEVRAGEEGQLRSGHAPEVAPVVDLAHSMAWSSEFGETQPQEDDQGDTLPGIGSLRARRPGERQNVDRPLTLARHTVTVRIVGNVARTEIEEVFRNDGDQVLEGVYRFPLPTDAQIARLALDVEGTMQEGSFVERGRASLIWTGVIRNATRPEERRHDEEFIWVPGPWHDPAILEWQRGGQFELRIFPIPAHGERRVILGYTQTVTPRGDRRRYVYPLAHSADGSTRVGQFDVDVRIAGARSVAATGYDVRSSAEADATRLRMSEAGFLPKGDLAIEYELPGAARELSFWTYQGAAAVPPPANSREEDREVNDIQRQLAADTRPYVALALRPRLPRSTERRTRDYMLVVDSSQSMVGERYQRAVRLASHVVGELDRRDRFTVLACDYTCRTLPGGLRAPSAQSSRDLARWLESIEPAGASDLVATLREVVANAQGQRREGRELHLVYFGDGVATTGYRRASSLAAEARAIAGREHVVVSTVGIGSEADTLALSAIARATGGHYVPYVPGERASVAALSVLETTYGVSLQAPRVTLPDGVSEIAPSELPTIRAGQEVVIVGRMDRPRVSGDVVLRGTVAGRPFEQRYTVDLVPTTSAGNLFVPRLWAAAQIEERELRGRGEERARDVAMSKAFGVMSRHTSLLVLESEAMFRAFGVDRRTDAPVWTGEEDVVAGGADGSVQIAGAQPERPADAPANGYGGEGRGRGSREGGGGGGGAPGGAGDFSANRSRSASRPTSMPSRPMPPQVRVAPRPVVVAQPTAPAMERAEAAPAQRAPMNSEVSNPWPGTTATTPMPPPMQPQRPRGPGQWMRRVWFRTGEVTPSDAASSSEREAAARALAALEANRDSRDRHRAAVRALSRAGQLERALEIADAWVARDRTDAEALTAKADLLGRMGRRDDALRLLTGTVDISPNSKALQLRLANAFDRAGQPERACAHRIAIAEIDENDGNALGAAMRCERQLSRNEAAERLLSAVRDPDTRVDAERAAAQVDEGRRFGGDLTIDASWDEPTDIDLSIVSPQGTRLSWMGGRTTVVGERAMGNNSERLGVRYAGAGSYFVEVSRSNPADTRIVHGQLRIRILNENRTVRFTLSDARTMVARVRVNRESRLEQVTGTVVPRSF